MRFRSKLAADACGGHGLDPGCAELGVRAQPDLPAGQADVREGIFFQLHRHERDGDLLAHGQQHVQLPPEGEG